MDEVLKDFIVECYEGLDHLDRDLVTLEKEPKSEEILSRIFRTTHTIKGSSGFLALHKLEALAHVGENLLSLLRDGELELTADMISALLAMADAVRAIVDQLEADQTEGPHDYASLIETLGRLSEGSPAAGTPGDAPQDAEPSAPEAATPEAADSEAESPEATASESASEAPAPAAEVVATPSPEAEGQRAAIADSTIRVDVGLLDKLMNLVGELVLARNQILQQNANETDASYNGTTQRLNLVTTELQEGVMKTRMQPIGNIWGKFPRVVRDLALQCGRDVRLEMEGRDTELDKTILEAIKDPLTHAIRNSVDHGIEPPAERAAAGKPEQGCVTLRAFHEGGHVNIEISDDGRGIDKERVKTKAIANGLITSERAARLSEKELINLITLPGFSTAEKVTNVSGRGVGMDVVRTNIEKIGGTIDIHGQVGVGTTIKIKIPLTLAIIPALIVTSQNDRFAIPQVSLLELLRLEGEQIEQGIEHIHGTPVYRLRGTLLPLVYLDSVLATRGGEVDEAHDQTADDSVVSIVVLQADDQPFGLVVQSILDTEEIVVKPLGKELMSASAFAGAAIMGDGKVALILDVMGLAQRANVIGEGREDSSAEVNETSHLATGERETLLLVSTGKNEQAAIDLSSVSRLEELDASDVEYTAGQQVVQYRGEIMPLVHLSKVIGSGGRPDTDQEKLQVVVIRHGDRSVGLAVEAILDILDDEITLVGHRAKRGIRGAVTVGNRVTDLLDVETIIQHELSGFIDEPQLTGV